VLDLARDLILLSGLQPEVDIPITFTGIRPGEKLFEELLTAEEGTVPSPHEKIFVARKTSLPEDRLDPLVDDLLAAAVRQDEACLRALLAALIPTHMLNGQAA
jgi:FlaA1/EpsC-like NDP-sugar epimerase